MEIILAELDGESNVQSDMVFSGRCECTLFNNSGANLVGKTHPCETDI